MVWSRAMAVWIAIGLAVVAGLALGRVRGAPPPPDDAVPVQVRLEAAQDGDMVTFTMSLTNRTDVEVGDLYLAGRVPVGAEFLGVEGAPAGSWFRGYEGAGTPFQAAVWLTERLPPQSDLGPFRYRVRVSGDAVGEAQGWVHWQEPFEGTAISAPAVISQGSASTPTPATSQTPLLVDCVLVHGVRRHHPAHREHGEW